MVHLLIPSLDLAVHSVSHCHGLHHSLSFSSPTSISAMLLLVTAGCWPVRASSGDTLAGTPSLIWRIGAKKAPPADAPSSHPKVADAPNTERERPDIACLSPHAISQQSRSRPHRRRPVFYFFTAEGGEGGCSRGERVERQRHIIFGRRAPPAAALRPPRARLHSAAAHRLPPPPNRAPLCRSSYGRPPPLPIRALPAGCPISPAEKSSEARREGD